MDKIWNENMERLSRLVLKTWQLFLPDVFKKFRNDNLKNYGLFPSRYQTLSGIFSLKKVQEPKFLIFLINITKSAINIQNLVTQNNDQNILYT